MKTRWFAQGDPDSATFATKSEAEARARKLWPAWTEERCYARVFYHETQDAVILVPDKIVPLSEWPT